MSSSVLWSKRPKNVQSPIHVDDRKKDLTALWFNLREPVKSVKTDPVEESAAVLVGSDLAPAHTFGVSDPWPDEGLNRIAEIIDKVNPDRLSEIECLEMLFYVASRRKDARKLAETAIETFGSLGGVFTQSGVDLRKKLNMSSALITQIVITKSCLKHILRAQIPSRRKLNSFAALMGYLTIDLREADREILRGIFLDAKNAILMDEEMARGTINAVSIYPREVARKAITYGASSVILAHNHLSEDPRPSQADVSATLKTRDALRTFGVVLHDHVIIARRRCFSMRQEKLI